jgi:eukaryotic-like serine/threonine-protein kinase
MSHPPGRDAELGLFDEVEDDAEEHRTLVDNSFWVQPKIPEYPTLATFGRFEILGRLARGGMAEIYLARDRQSDGSVRHVVVKRVLPEMEGNDELLSMFLEEGKIAVRLYHANVCHVYEVGEIDGTAFMALEWVYGPSLHTVIKRAAAKGVPTAWPIAVEIVSSIASALEYVHQAKGLHGEALNIVHRDVSPHNVMVSWTGQPKLLDFGIAKTSAEGPSGKGAAGKYAYMSPEQAQSHPIDARSDVFALGIVLYETLAGRALYDRATLLDTLSAIVREEVPSVRRERPDLPEALDYAVQRALAKDPRERFQSAAEMRASLKQLQRMLNQQVPEKRIALALAGLFDASERTPLKDAGLQLSGAFTTLTEEGAAVVLTDSVTYETFDHGAEAEEEDIDVDVSFEPERKKRGVALWIALFFLAFVVAGGGTAAALHFLR